MRARLLLIALLLLLVATLFVESAPKGGRGGGGRGGGRKKDKTEPSPEPEAEPEPEIEAPEPESKVEPEPEPKSGSKGKGKGKGKGHKTNLKELKEKLKKKGPKDRKTRPPGFGKPEKKRFTQEEKNKIKGACGKKKKGCKGQSDKVKARKEKNKERLVKSRFRRLRGAKNTTEARAQAQQKAQREIQKTFDAKKAVLTAQGITTEDEIEPYDDGMWQKDMVLTEEQAERIIERAANPSTGDGAPPSLPDGLKRHKRYTLFLEENLGAKFDVMPIPIFISEWFSAEEKQLILNAIKDIQDKSCISFEEVELVPDASHIFFDKDEYQEVCATGNIGRVGDQNNVWLSFSEECQEQMFGSIVHQTMHALGVDHQHIRYDRNAKVIIDYDNLDPQMLDFYLEGDHDAFSTYGMPYDYFSVMHFSAYTGALDLERPTMQAVDEPTEFFTEVIGQRKGLSDRDAALLRKMYCMPDCEDVQVWCGWWKTSGYCEQHTAIMIEYCPKSCGFCPNAVNLEALEKVAAKEAATDSDRQRQRQRQTDPVFFFFKK